MAHFSNILRDLHIRVVEWGRLESTLLFSIFIIALMNLLLTLFLVF